MKCIFKNNLGFTLIELSISLMIIGFLVALVTSGSYIKKRAELNNIIEQLAKIELAYNSFKDIYKTLPGDLISTSMPLFGTTNGNISILYGDGNSLIDNGQNSQNNYESLISLQHLSAAGLISGNFTGDWNNNVAMNFFPIENTKGSYFGNISNNTNLLNNPSVIFYAKIFDSNHNGMIDVSTETILSAISPNDMYKIDYKYDDGFPNTGNIIAFNGADNSSGCINNSVTPDIYNTTSINGCYFNIILDKKYK